MRARKTRKTHTDCLVSKLLSRAGDRARSSDPRAWGYRLSDVKAEAAGLLKLTTYMQKSRIVHSALHAWERHLYIRYVEYSMQPYIDSALWAEGAGATSCESTPIARRIRLRPSAVALLSMLSKTTHALLLL